MGYLSLVLPKPLFPLYGVPIIHHVINNMIHLGVERILIPLCYQKSKILEYLDRVGEIGIEVEPVVLDEVPPGIAMTIYSTRSYLRNEPFVTILGDDVTITPSLANMVEAFFSHKAVALEAVVKERSIAKLRSTCCVKLGPSQEILEIAEKPINPATNLRGCGVYVFSPEIFTYIENTPSSDVRGEVEITDTINVVSTQSRAYGEFVNGVNINVNSMDDLLEAWLRMRERNAKKESSPSIHSTAEL